MIKKKFILFMLVLCSCFMAKAHAQTQKLVVWMTNGEKVYYELASLPKTSFMGTEIVISTSDITVSYPLEEIQKYTYETTPSGVESVHSGNDISIKQNGTDFSFYNLKEGTLITVYSIDGVMVNKQTSKGGISTVVSLSNLPTGVYVIKANGITYKVMKQ